MKAKMIPESIRWNTLYLRLGGLALYWRRHLLWHTDDLRLVWLRPEVRRPYLRAEHTTPLLHRLRGEDMTLQRNKVINLRPAAARLGGLTLRPGGALSFWRIVDWLAHWRDYVEGMILRNDRVAPGMRGGLYQMTNLFYWMTLHAPLTVTERWQYGYDVFSDPNHTQPFDSGTTCFCSYISLMMRNDTPDTWWLVLQVTDTHPRRKWQADDPQIRRYEVCEKEHEIRGEY